MTPKNIKVYPRDKKKFKVVEKAMVVNWNRAKSYDDVIDKTKSLSVPFYVYGDAKYPPIVNKNIESYILFHDETNFIGNEAMILYSDKDYLIIPVDSTEDYERAKYIGHQINYQGSSIKIVLLLSSPAHAAIPQIIADEIEDFEIVIETGDKKFMQNYTQLVQRCDIMLFRKINETSLKNLKSRGSN